MAVTERGRIRREEEEVTPGKRRSQLIAICDDNIDI